MPSPLSTSNVTPENGISLGLGLTNESDLALVSAAAIRRGRTVSHLIR